VPNVKNPLHWDRKRPTPTTSIAEKFALEQTTCAHTALFWWDDASQVPEQSKGTTEVSAIGTAMPRLDRGQE
jgi:hypothetical protein